MGTRVFVDGRVVEERAALVSVFDRGFLYGDSVYEVTRTAGGRPVDLDRHLDRLERSALAIGLTPPARHELTQAIARTLAAAENRESYLRIVVTRGAGDIGLDPALADRPLLVIIVKTLALPDPELYRRGVDVALVEIQRNARRALDPAIKSGNYLNNILALREARARGAYESIMLNADGRLVEGSTSNLFVVRGEKVMTPALSDGLLEGITRGRVLELATAAGHRVDEAQLDPLDLRSADEAFLTSSLRGVLPVARVDGRALAGGAPGRVTTRLIEAYATFLQRVATGTSG